MPTDVVIVGGAFAGLAAATYLGRARRSVLIIDKGEPRNRFAAASHGFLGFDGSNPADILARAREQLAAYPTVRLINGEAVAARAEDGGFAFTLASGETLTSRLAILAFGLRDSLDPIPGLAERWGKSVLHCPYCHGYEYSDRRLGVLWRTPMSVHQASLVAEWGPTTLYLNGADLAPDSAATLAARGVRVEPARIKALIGEGTLLQAIELDDGRESPLDALYVAPKSTLSSPIAADLGALIEDGPLGPILKTNAEKKTTVPGLYAAGDIAHAPHSVSFAVADGVMAGTSAHRTLVFG
ncbi:NAD(P)/FAD-dependent oxidoreductase [Pleomorphomonas oryzae]|uniref:NAD(P)/FAD-dependent oxidoreductase n=1 Tax=Pleomorphomonas oryzae TaxID=261934 RepID=UPI0003FD08FF|nr:NAD(P)/FAD-dependent oxidoreductase [Pleomorphomonas oryzae]